MGKEKKISLSSIPVEQKEERKRVEPDEWYIARFEKAEMNPAGKFGPYIRLFFKLLSGETTEGKEAKGMQVTRIVDAKLNPASPLWAFAKGLSGAEPKVGENFDISAYFGQKYRVLVVDRKPKKGAESDEIYQEVKSVKAYKKA